MSSDLDAGGAGAAKRPAGAALVSVVVATNRASPFLTEALQSVIDQTYPRIEIFVVDDGSEDPAAVPRALAGIPRLTIVRQAAAGVATARNAGAERTTGEFLVFLDDDDRWHPERIERQVRTMQHAADAVVGYCGMQSIDASGRVIALADQIPVADERDIARRTTGIILPNVMIRRAAFVAVSGFDPALRLAEDLDLLLKLARLGRFVFTPDALVDYRSHANNTTKRYRELCRSIDQVVRAHLQEAVERHDGALVKAHRESLRANDRFAWWSAMRSARDSLREGRAAAALSEIAWAIRFAPWGVPDALVRRARGVR